MRARVHRQTVRQWRLEPTWSRYPVQAEALGYERGSNTAHNDRRVPRGLSTSSATGPQARAELDPQGVASGRRVDLLRDPDVQTERSSGHLLRRLQTALLHLS